MAGKAITKETIRKNTIVDMTKLGMYKAEYEPMIDIYCEMREQYERLTKEYKDSGYKYTEATADGGSKKHPVVAILESLRKDILQYSDRLGLNPKSMSDNEPKGNKKKKSKLTMAMSSFDGK